MRYQILMDSCGDGEEKQYSSGILSTVKLGIVEEEYKIPKTSCPAPGDFAKKIQDEVEHIYIVSVSSRLSGTYNSARMAVDLIVEEKEESDRQKEQDYCVIDSKSASAGETLLAWMIQDMEEHNLSFERIKHQVEQIIARRRTRFVLQDLTMLEKSGRLKGIKAKLADTFHICPILEGTKEGTIAQRGQARGQKKAIAMLLKQIMKDCKEQLPTHMVISHCHCPERAFVIKVAISERFPDIRIRITETGEISTIYAGEGAVIAAYA